MPKKEKVVDASGFSLMLQRAYTDGLVQDAALIVEEGVGKIKAFDMASVLFVESTCEDIPIEDGEYGLGDLGIITNFIKSNTSGAMTINIKKNRMNIIIKGHGKLMYLLTEPQAIGSRPNSEDDEQPSAENIIPSMTHKVHLKKETVKDALSYISLIKPRSITVETTKKGNVNICAGRESEHKFSIKLGKLQGKKKLNLSEELLTEHFVAVMNNLSWDNEAEPKILLKKEEDIVVTQDDENIWAIERMIKEDDEFDFQE